ncbi:MAG: glycosyltransferase family 4 protein [Prevotella sp.]
MKIVYVVEDFSENGGVERIVSDKANTLAAELLHEVTLITVYRDSRPQRYQLHESVNFMQLDVPFAQKGNNGLARLASRMKTMFIAVYRLNRAVSRIKPDIIFFTTTLGAILLPFCLTKARKIYESHLARNFNPFNRLFFLTELSAERIVCLTKGDARQFKHAREVNVIPNYVNTAAKHVVDYGVKKAIAVGRLEHQKGFDIMINCWQKVAMQYPDWQLHIYGEGAMREQLQQQINTLNLQDKVRLCGRNDNIMEVYSNYSLHLMTSRYEGLPMTLIEAQSCGLPSVVFNFKYGATDVVRSGHNGIVVKQNDCGLMSDAIAKMLSSEALRKEYGTNALSIGRRYLKENVFKKWMQIIN